MKDWRPTLNLSTVSRSSYKFVKYAVQNTVEKDGRSFLLHGRESIKQKSRTVSRNRLSF